MSKIGQDLNKSEMVVTWSVDLSLGGKYYI